MIARPTILLLLASSTTLAAMAARSAPPTARAQGPDGKALYEENCRKCHGVRGVPPKAIKEKFPKVGKPVVTKNGKGKVVRHNVLKDQLVVRLDGGSEVEVPLNDIVTKQ